jgi:transcription antitermination factor NusG
MNYTDHPHEADRNWYAVFTVPQHEKTVVKHLDLRAVESFLPTYETTRVWKNRQKMRVVLPLFPTYLFVHISSRERARVLESSFCAPVAARDGSRPTMNW